MPQASKRHRCNDLDQGSQTRGTRATCGPPDVCPTLISKSVEAYLLNLFLIYFESFAIYGSTDQKKCHIMSKLRFTQQSAAGGPFSPSICGPWLIFQCILVGDPRF